MKPSVLSHFAYDLLRYVEGDEGAIAIAQALLNRESAVATVEGPPGIGKTTLIRMLTGRFDYLFPAGAHWILPGYGPIAHQLDLASRKIPDGSLTVIDGANILGSSETLTPLLALAANFKAQSSVLIVGQDLSAFHSVTSQQIYLPNRAGSGVVARWMDDFMRNGLGEEAGNQLIDRHSHQLFRRAGLVNSFGQPLRPNSKAAALFIRATQAADRELAARVRDNPELVYQISPRKFEELVAHVYQELGYDVCLTPASRDGGRDLHVARKDHLGSFLFFVECKRYSKERPVGVGLVRQLYGVVAAEQASAGIMVTTSSFTTGAKAYQETVPHRLTLQEFSDLQRWLTNTGF